MMQTPTHKWARYRPHLVAQAISASSTITVPSSVNDGDLGLLFDTAYSGGGIPSWVVPTGWTAHNGISNNTTTRSIFSYKSLTSADQNVVLTGMSGGLAAKTLMVWGTSAYGNLADPWPRAVKQFSFEHMFGLAQHSGEIIGDVAETASPGGVLIATSRNNPGNLDFSSFGVQGVGTVDADSVLINNNYQMTRYLIFPHVRRPGYARSTFSALGMMQSFALYMSP